jgi:hypothetical protein
MISYDLLGIAAGKSRSRRCERILIDNIEAVRHTLKTDELCLWLSDQECRHDYEMLQERGTSRVISLTLVVHVHDTDLDAAIRVATNRLPMPSQWRDQMIPYRWKPKKISLRLPRENAK